MWVTPICIAAILNYCDPFPKTILEVSKRLDYVEAKKVSMVIDEYAQKRDINPFLIAAILSVESNFGEKLVSKDGKDHGPMQINEWWFSRLGIDRKQVLSMEGGVKWGTKILEMNRQEYKGKGCWWSLYNSHRAKARRQYEVKVKSVFDKLNVKLDCTSVKTDGSSLRLLSATEPRLSY